VSEIKKTEIKILREALESARAELCHVSGAQMRKHNAFGKATNLKLNMKYEISRIDAALQMLDDLDKEGICLGAP
jgi:hypothetical protein